MLMPTVFQSIDATKEKTANLLRDMTQEELQHCFEEYNARM